MKRLIIILFIIAVFIFIMGYLVFTGVIWPNSFFAASYKVQGIDVSSYQKQIDFKAVTKNPKIKFIFIKATEGTELKDKFFDKNWKAATEAGLIKGAYHYYRTEDSGIDQAAFFIKTVNISKNTLPTVIDVEEKMDNKEKYIGEIKAFLTTLEEHYGKKPILYVTYDTYEKYVS